MFCTVKSRTGGSELLDAPETLKFFGVDQIKNNLMLDINMIMNAWQERKGFFIGKRNTGQS